MEEMDSANLRLASNQSLMMQEEAKEQLRLQEAKNLKAAATAAAQKSRLQQAAADSTDISVPSRPLSESQQDQHASGQKIQPSEQPGMTPMPRDPPDAVERPVGGKRKLTSPLPSPAKRQAFSRHASLVPHPSPGKAHGPVPASQSVPVAIDPPASDPARQTQLPSAARAHQTQPGVNSGPQQFGSQEADKGNLGQSQPDLGSKRRRSENGLEAKGSALKKQPRRQLMIEEEEEDFDAGPNANAGEAGAKPDASNPLPLCTDNQQPQNGNQQPDAAQQSLPLAGVQSQNPAELPEPATAGLQPHQEGAQPSDELGKPASTRHQSLDPGNPAGEAAQCQPNHTPEGQPGHDPAAAEASDTAAVDQANTGGAQDGSGMLQDPSSTADESQGRAASVEDDRPKGGRRGGGRGRGRGRGMSSPTRISGSPGLYSTLQYSTGILLPRLHAGIVIHAVRTAKMRSELYGSLEGVA